MLLRASCCRYLSLHINHFTQGTLATTTTTTPSSARTSTAFSTIAQDTLARNIYLEGRYKTTRMQQPEKLSPRAARKAKRKARHQKRKASIKNGTSLTYRNDGHRARPALDQSNSHRPTNANSTERSTDRGMPHRGNSYTFERHGRSERSDNTNANLLSQSHVTIPEEYASTNQPSSWGRRREGGGWQTQTYGPPVNPYYDPPAVLALAIPQQLQSWERRREPLRQREPPRQRAPSRQREHSKEQTHVRHEISCLSSKDIPSPSQGYLNKSMELSIKLSKPVQLLVILDLNGTLLFRKRGRNTVGSTRPVLRPGIQEFMQYLFDNFKVMIWTSAQPQNAQLMVNAVLSKDEQGLLLALWARDTLGLTQKQYNEKVQVYKRLDRVWGGEFMLLHPNQPDQIMFDQTNTVLFDDSDTKAAYNPYNLVKIPEFTASESQMRDDNVLWDCIYYLEQLKWQSNVSAFIRKNPAVF